MLKGVAMETINVTENGQELRISYEEIMKYHGTGFPGGAAYALKVMQRVFPLLDGGNPPERREIVVETAFTGQGGRDAFEMVTRCVTDGRYHVDPDIPEAKNEEESPGGHYWFRFLYRGKAIIAVLFPEFGHKEFNDLSRKPEKTPEDIKTLAKMRLELAERVLHAAPENVYRIIKETETDQ
jgi:hypothetical protein